MNRTDLRNNLKWIWAKWGKRAGTFLLAVITVWATLLFVSCYWGEALSLEQLSEFHALRGSRPAPKDVVVVAIDRKAVKELSGGARYWPRIHTAHAAKRIISVHPRVLIMDLKFPPEDTDPIADEILESALRAGPTVIWSGESTDSPQETLGRADFQSEQLASAERFRRAAKMEIPMWQRETHGMRVALTATTRPDASLFERAPIARPLVALGHFDIQPPDPLAHLNYYGPSRHIPTISIADVLRFNRDDLRDAFAGKIVLLGYGLILDRGMATSEEFTVSAPGRRMFGVEIHATVVGNLLDGSWLRHVSPAPYTIGVAFLVFYTAWTLMTRPPRRALMLVFAAYSLAALGVYLAFSLYKVWIPGLYSVLLAGALQVILMFAFNDATCRNTLAKLRRVARVPGVVKKGGSS